MGELASLNVKFQKTDLTAITRIDGLSTCLHGLQSVTTEESFQQADEIFQQLKALKMPVVGDRTENMQNSLDSYRDEVVSSLKNRLVKPIEQLRLFVNDFLEVKEEVNFDCRCREGLLGIKQIDETRKVSTDRRQLGKSYVLLLRRSRNPYF